MKKLLFISALALGLTVAGCGGSSDKKTAAPPTASSSPPPAISTAPSVPPGGGSMVTLVKTKEGMALMDGDGRALYLFEKDEKKNASTCDGACAQAWPPYVATSVPQAGQGVRADLLGSFKRADGTMQVSYAGHPLYYFVKDKAPGDINGQDVEGFGAEWYLVGADGKIIH